MRASARTWRPPITCGDSMVREQALYRARLSAAGRAAGTVGGRRGSYAAMEQTYNAYKWSKIHAQDLDELA